jgi:hypothetical protein
LGVGEEALLIVVLICALFCVWVLETRYRGRKLLKERKAKTERDAKDYDRVCQIFTEAIDNGWAMAEIKKVVQHAKTGTKASVDWANCDATTAAIWLEGEWVYEGDVIVVSGKQSYGTHADRDVYYVDDLWHVIRRVEYAAWVRVDGLRREKSGSA